MSKFNSMKKKTLNVAVLACLSAVTLSSVSMSANAADPVVFSFSTIGDTRQDVSTAKQDVTTKLYLTTPTPPTPPTSIILPQDQQWLQNTKAWSRVLRTVQSQKANMLFVNGDMIMGYGRATVPTAWSTTPPATPAAVLSSDLVKFYTQYAYWRGMVANSFETGTYVVPVPGNHESQCSSAVTGNGLLSSTNPNGCDSVANSGKNAYVENENAWRANMGDLISDIGNNGRFQSVVGTAASNVSGLTAATAPTSTTDANITTDQSSLSYSFDITTAAGKLHFAVINTDAVGFDGHAPIGWLTNDFATAHANGATKYFVFGHKPAFTYNYLAPAIMAPAGLDADTNTTTGRDAFWKLIAEYNATYFSGHEHTTKVDQHVDPTGTYTTNPWQVLVGSGGSPFDPKFGASSVSPSTDRNYAWATVRVHQSGAVTLDLYAFSDTFGPTSVIQSIANLQ